MKYDFLIEKAIEAQQFSYSPYSNFKVGAALLCKDGKIFTGCNVENSSYPASICAERTALTKAISEGAREFLAIAIVASDLENICYPCGICRQMLGEFSPNMDIVLYSKKETNVFKLNKLLPNDYKVFDVLKKN